MGFRVVSYWIKGGARLRKIITNALIITMNDQEEIIQDGWMMIDDDIITQIGKEPIEITDTDEVIDVKGDIVMPGLINTHGHATMSLLRGFGDDLPLDIWLKEKMWPVEGQFKEEHVKWGTALAIIEMLKTGTTTFSDMYIFMDVVAEAVKESGIRANLSRGILGMGTVEQRKNKLMEASAFAKHWNHQAEGRITTMLSPHSPYTCSSSYIEKILEEAIDIEVPIQIHMSETRAEVDNSYRDNGMRPVELLEKIGVFDHRALIAHAVHVNLQEIKILAEHDIKISHNPGSNLKLGSGIAPVPEMIRQGIRVSLGTDSAASNNNLDMFEEMRLAALIHKGKEEDPLAIPAKLALKMATSYGAEALFLQKQIGSLEAGKKADFIIINKNQAHFYPMHDPVSHLVYAASGHDVKDVYINGKQIVKNGELLTLDEEKIYHMVNNLVKQWV